MSPERWQQVERLFQMALERKVEDRDAFLETACDGDQDLRDEVRHMLTGDQDAGGFLQKPAVEVAARRLAEESQQLTPGAMIGPYQVVGLLGSGGMGEVYKARDTRLGRTVAVKALQAQLASGQGRERLLREAQSASALNNPHIVTIYDVVTEGSRDSIVMEYLDGESLDVLIARKELEPGEVIQFGIEIADALSAAHAAGIVHRDIKPGNIMAVHSASGQRSIKVLDFGLAKQTAASPTALTQEGMILGTVAYMSPEQAEGKKVDTRSDVFSFGAVLYEMTTGRAAFQGDTGASIMAAILRDEPAPVRSLAPGIPQELDWVIALCLKKAPQRRWQSMSDLKVALEEARDKLASGKTDEAVAVVRRRGLPRFWWAAGLAGLAVAAAAGGYWGRRTAPLHDAIYERLTYRRGDVTSARFTPDGQTIIYSAEWDNAPSTIYSTRAGSRESRSLGFPPGKILSLSPTGEMAILSGTLANTFNSGTLSRAALAGGAPREFLADVIDADWADASDLAVIRAQGAKTRVEFPVGKVVFEVEGRRPPFDPRVSPNGEGLAFFQFDGEVGDYALMYVPRSGGTPRILTRGWRGVGRAAWSPDGSEIWFVASVPGGDPALRGVTLAGRERVVAHTLGWMVLDDVSRDGRVLATRLNSRIAMFFGRIGESDEHDLSWLDTSAVFDISVDGKNVLFEELSYGEGRNPAIYFRKSDDSPAVRLGNCSRPSLSPDGKSVACVHSEGRVSSLMLLPVGAGEVRQLPNDGFHYEQVEWLPDGQRVLFSGSQNGGAQRNFIQGVNGGGPKPVTPAGVMVRRISPDGKLAIGIHDGGLFLHQLEEGSTSKRLGAAEPGEFAVRWAADQRSFFTAVPKGGVSFQVYRVDAATGQKKLWKELKPPDPVGVTMFSLTVAPNGESYAYSYQRDMADLYLISGLR